MTMPCYSAILSISVARLGTTVPLLKLTNTTNPFVSKLQQLNFHSFCRSSLVGLKPSTKVEVVDKASREEIFGKVPEQTKRQFSWKGNFEPEFLSKNPLTKREFSSMGDKLKIVIFYGSTRNGRMCDRVGITIKNAVEAQGLEAIVLDPLKLPVEMLRLPLHFMPNPAEAPEWLLETNDTIKNADGFIFISAEYNCGVPPALANLVDHFPPPSFRHRPVGIVTYSLGQFGGTRAATLLRPMASELGLISIPATVPIPVVNNVIDEKGNVLEDRVSSNISKLVRELEWYAAGLKATKQANPPPT